MYFKVYWSLLNRSLSNRPNKIFQSNNDVKTTNNELDSYHVYDIETHNVTLEFWHGD